MAGRNPTQEEKGTTLGISLEELLKQKTTASTVMPRHEMEHKPAADFFQQGVKLLKSDQPFEALAYLFAARVMEPTDLRAANNIVVAFWQLDCPELAIKTARDILRQDPENTRALEHLEMLTKEEY